MVRVLPPAQPVRASIRRAGLNRRVRLAGPVIGLVLLVAACSDDSAEPGATATGAGATGSASSAPSGATSSAAPEATKNSTKPVPAPPIDTQTPSVAITTAPPVRVGTTATLSNGVKVQVSKINTVQVEASGPGDIAGDGVAVHLTVRNSSTKPFDLNGLAVTASYGKAQPASPGGASTGDLLTGSLKVGDKARGVYVFTVPKSKAGSVQVQVSSSASAAILIFKR
jgi:hypothetical protein